MIETNRKSKVLKLYISKEGFYRHDGIDCCFYIGILLAGYDECRIYDGFTFIDHFNRRYHPFYIM